MTVEAVITTIGEPQTDECHKALQSQIVPFEKITVLKNVSPNSEAHNQGLEQATCNWCLFVDADMILNQGLLSLFKENMGAGNRVYSYVYQLWDSFLKVKIKGIRLYNPKIAKKFPYKNIIGTDRIARNEAREKGFLEIDYKKIVIGTHFLNPSDEQVYKRFLMRGIKEKHHLSGKEYVPVTLANTLKKLFEETKNKQYLLAITAFQDGMKIKRKKDYDINFGIKEYREAKKNG